MPRTRRQFIRDLGLSAAAIPFVLNLPGLAFANQQKRKQRIIFMFSPNGVVRKNFWPDEVGRDFKLKEILSPLKPYQDKLLLLNGAVRQGARRRRRPHARHGLPADRHRAVPRQHPGRLRHARRLGQGDLHRSGDQELPPEGRGDADAVRLAGIRRDGARPRRHLDALVVRRAEQAGHADRRPAADVRQALRPGEGPGRAQERAGRREGRPEESRRGRRLGRPPADRRARHVRARDGGGAEAGQGRRRPTRCR